MNCKPNDLAVSVNTDMPANNGLIVRVIRRHTNEPGWNFGDSPSWWCESATPMTWFFKKTGQVHKSHQGPVPDRCLRPIRDGDLDRLKHLDVADSWLRILKEKTEPSTGPTEQVVQQDVGKRILEEATA